MSVSVSVPLSVSIFLSIFFPLRLLSSYSFHRMCLLLHVDVDKGMTAANRCDSGYDAKVKEDKRKVCCDYLFFQVYLPFPLHILSSVHSSHKFLKFSLNPRPLYHV